MEYTYTVVVYSASGLAMVQKRYDKLEEAVEMFHSLTEGLVHGASADVIAVNQQGIMERIGKFLK